MAARAGYTKVPLGTVEDTIGPPAGSDGSEIRQLQIRADEALPGFRARVLRLVRTATAAGSHPVLITQPLLWGPARDDATGADLGRIAAKFQGIATDSATFWSLLERYNDQTRAVAAETGTPVIDLARALPKSSGLYLDSMHYSAAGSEKVAAIVGARLCAAVGAWYPDHMTGHLCPGQ